MTRKEAIDSLRKICFENECTAVSLPVCKDSPQDCKIIQQVMRKGENEKE